VFAPFTTTAKEEILSPFPLCCADPAMASCMVNLEKPHQGVASKNPALHQGITWSNSTTALGLRSLAVETRVRSRCTGKERDAESGLDNFGARYNASSMGRFMSADPVFMNVMRVMDPQRLNLYAYGRNNPLVYTDPTGKDIVSGTGDQKAIKSALVEIARHPGGRQMLTKLDNLTQKITLSTTKDKIYDNNGTRTPGHHIADPPDAPINRTTDKAGNVDITSPNVKVEIDPSFAQTMRDAQDSNAPKSDAQLLGHELTETEHQDFQPGFNPDQHEGQTNSEVDSMLGSSNDMSKKDAEKFVDNLLKPNTNNQQQQQQPPPPPKCTGDNKQNCSN
jgi:RHS repeat-associated protein